ncbi:MAG: Bug family tripartite tricarboxylate transporter substrate binding protein [Burkholderiales bacterium]
MRISVIIVFVTALFGAPLAAAQSYPSKPIRFVIGFPAGSTVDVVPRMVLEEIRKNTGATILVDNRPGALGTIGMDLVTKAEPDGYMLLASASATHSSGPQLTKKPPAVDPIKGFTHIGGIFRFDVGVVVNPAQGYRNASDLIEAAKKNPDKLTFGYGSATGQVAAQAFLAAAGIRATGVSYKGQPPALVDLLGGQINFVAADIGVLVPHIRSGKLVGVGIASNRRSPIIPNVPTFAEAGVKDLELSGWVGVSGPAGLSPGVVDWWSKALTQAFSNKALVEQILGTGLEPETATGEAMQRLVREQFDAWGKHIRAAKIELQ